MCRCVKVRVLNVTHYNFFVQRFLSDVNPNTRNKNKNNNKSIKYKRRSTVTAVDCNGNYNDYEDNNIMYNI